VEGPAQVVGGSPPVNVRPEILRYLLAVEAVVRRERKKLDQGSGPPEMPLILPDGTGPHPDREAAEHPYPESLWFMIHHCCLLLAAMIIMEVDRDYPPAKQGPQTESTASFAFLGTPSPGRVAPTGPACVS
jgi:hypothetical protein